MLPEILAPAIDLARQPLAGFGYRLRDPVVIRLDAILGLACLAADEGDWHRAAGLHGVAQAFLDRIGQPWHEPEASYRQDSLDQVRGHLGHDQFERAYASGMGLSLDQAFDLATGKGPPSLIFP